MKTRRLAPIVAAAAVLILAGCGTRLPDSAFTPYVVSATSGSTTSANGAAGTGNGTSQGNGLGTPSTTGTGTHGNGESGLGTSGGNGNTTTGTGTGQSGNANSSNPGSGNSGPNPTTSSATGSKSGGKANFASAPGVTATTINVCNIVTEGGPFGPYQFTPSYYGAAAFFAALNAAGGIHGRTVNFVSHPDDGTDSGDLQQVHTCIDANHAFAFVGNNIYQYGGASYVNAKDVPDIGGQPISTAYYIYPHLYTIDGDHQPRNGKTLGLKGYEWQTDDDNLYFKNVQHVKHVGVVYYDQASSQYGANNIAQGFKLAGVPVSMYQVNLGLPNFASTVAQMKADGVDTVADALDLNGSEKLCGAIEQNTAFLNQMKIKLSTLANWTASLNSDLSGTPKCAAKSWVDAYSVNFQDTSNPQVAKYQAAMSKYFPSDLPHNHQFALEGWIAAQWFTDAAASCGADLTHACLEKFMNRKQEYTAHGLLTNDVGFYPEPAKYYHGGTTTQCVSAAQWSVSANKWITRASPSRNCYQAKAYGYQLTAPT